jgi:phosphoinositide-3-kinase regulatory subunit 4
MVPDDPEESVRICYADNVYKIAETAKRFLDCSQYMSEIGVLDKSVQTVPGAVKTQVNPSLRRQNSARYTLELSQMQETISRIILELVMGHKQTPTIRRALLHHVDQLGKFFGKKQCNDILLPMLPAFLNDRDEQLRAVFFKQIIHVCMFVGQTSVEHYLLPYIEQALSAVEETVSVNALECLAALCKHKLLRKRVLLGAVERAAPLLCHPSQWVRRSAITFIASAGANLELVDSHAFLLPILSPFMRREPISLCVESALSACLKPAMSREMFDRVVSDAVESQAPSGKSDIKKRDVSPKTKIKPTDAAGKVQNEQQKTAGDGNNIVPMNTRNNSRQSLLSPILSGDWPPFGEPDDGEKMKAMEGYIRNLSSTMQSRRHTREVDNSEKLQSSIIGTNAGVGAGFYSNYDGSSEGIPLYSVPLNEKRGDTQASVSFSEDWNRIINVRPTAQHIYMATVSETPNNLPSVTSSPWEDRNLSEPTIGSDSQSQLGISASRVMGRSSFGISLGPRRMFEAEGEPEGLTLNLSRSAGANRISISESASNLNAESGGSVQPTTESPLGHSLTSPSIPDNQWRPRGVLIAHLQEHQRAVNKVVVSHDNSFFVSASDDGTVKVWDCKRLESNISFKSRLTYSLLGGKALGVCMIGSGPQVAASSSTGIIHVFSVDHVARASGGVEKCSGLVDVRKIETQEGSALSLQNYSLDGPAMLLYTTQRNGIHLCDLRAQKNAWSLKAKPSQGYISCTALASCHNWFVTATQRGVLTLWDLRFQIPVNTWQHPAGCFVESICPILSQADPMSPTMPRPYLYVAAGRDEVAIWNAEDGSCQQVFGIFDAIR